jgi:hypothetical protein
VLDGAEGVVDDHVRVVVLALQPAVPVHADHGVETGLRAFLICT